MCNGTEKENGGCWQPTKLRSPSGGLRPGGEEKPHDKQARGGRQRREEPPARAQSQQRARTNVTSKAEEEEREARSERNDEQRNKRARAARRRRRQDATVARREPVQRCSRGARGTRARACQPARAHGRARRSGRRSPVSCEGRRRGAQMKVSRKPPQQPEEQEEGSPVAEAMDVPAAQGRRRRGARGRRRTGRPRWRGARWWSSCAQTTRAGRC